MTSFQIKTPCVIYYVTAANVVVWCNVSSYLKKNKQSLSFVVHLSQKCLNPTNQK